MLCCQLPMPQFSQEINFPVSVYFFLKIRGHLNLLLIRPTHSVEFIHSKFFRRAKRSQKEKKQYANVEKRGTFCAYNLTSDFLLATIIVNIKLPVEHLFYWLKMSCWPYSEGHVTVEIGTEKDTWIASKSTFSGVLKWGQSLVTGRPWFHGKCWPSDSFYLFEFRRSEKCFKLLSY